ncbi:MAG: Antibiotic biosynthesis monooxygenase [uncultured Rubrobacteraceae bacterium]|jgi:heme oxygenase (staphylobilin-producing)|uniref:Antibiotic biosynthesis monooxygenase n=1 Tax=uncultured Rubrobacteraceae bacterium TaxID=349277 RepID=A0A6J4Q759_9ACTN|nr:MAG: Antibiotic biosynthesis monooxygenase [uncultured Rubrobacteraceae bacterium]
MNSLPVNEGAADAVVERFAASRGDVQGFPGFVSMEVLKSEGEDEVLVVTRWRDREAFDAWVGSEEFARAHSRGGTQGLLRGHPKMSSYEVAVERGGAV